ncbi:glycoside hydrolase family 3 C-terminal domain-containing protein [Solwaraspora sp. WMMD1047]|uniref:beta-glucosidase family protein n=1 Tax=Solwaraspora sp. WMMD1047 TaxID=3016102 RepID=UPI0024169F28|nr:glycoside hydrolase family 3 C-terminal domain-containing protein [Solwaraspora sp. WMMD1047]MDG4832708.1 glycoside hydrolase family 3 C-terminal domain-containing protein [Solwaraspora sp. WMMD1047]
MTTVDTARDAAASEAAIEAAVRALDLPTKVRLLTGQDWWTLPAIPQIGLGSLVMSDGPIGVRGTGWAPDDPSVALPSPTALAATWDPDLARTAGRLLGQECRRKGVHVLLAPTVNLHRSPLGGRHFECYSEDPLLTGEIGVGYVTGVQEQGVGTTVKHFVANDSETDRMTVDVRVSERALRELYLAPFERIVRAGAWGVMAAYNGVNGSTMTEHRALQRDLLKTGWGFDGMIVSDWTAARSTEATATGGLDVVMPALGDPWGAALVAAVRAGTVDEAEIDDKVRRVLRLAARVGILDGVPPAVAPDDRPAPLDGAAVAREVAVRSFVLARNNLAAGRSDQAAAGSAAGAAGSDAGGGSDGGLLPLDAGSLRRVAVLGALATDARIQGGGSAQVFPPHVISPLAGITAALPQAEVSYAIGADPRPKVPAATGLQWTPITAVLRAAGGRELYRAELDRATVRWMGTPPAGVDPAEVDTIELAATCTPMTSGEHVLTINGFGMFTLRVAGADIFEGLIIDEDADRATVFLSPLERRFPVPMTAGEPVEVRLTQKVPEGMAGFVSFTLGHAAPTGTPDELLAEAVALAADAEVAVVVVGTTEEVESEGFDRASLALPGRQDELVSRVAAANPRTVVVVNSGSPVLMPWADEVAAILLTWFPGQQAGAALADVLLGVAEPGGRLPTTWPRAADDCPALAVTPTDGVLDYREGVFVGYRGWRAEPLFPFGHGRGYTDWEYTSLRVDQTTDEPAAVVGLRNTGARPGREVVQVYVGPVEPDPERPERWLAGFATVTAAPGEEVTARVPLPHRATRTWVDGDWRDAPTDYRVEAAHSLADRRLAVTARLG